LEKRYINSCFLFLENLFKKGNNKPQIGFSKLLRRWKEVWQRRCIGIEISILISDNKE